MYDAVNLLVEAVSHLHQTGDIDPRPMDCFGTDSWEGGLRIAAYMKRVSIYIFYTNLNIPILSS